MFVQTEVTPNPNSLKFLPGKKVSNSGPYEITNKEDMQNELVRNILSINGVEGIFLGQDFISVNKNEKIKWDEIKHIVISLINDFYADGKEFVIDENIKEEDLDLSEIESKIVKILEEKIRPAVARDGGDIKFKEFKDGIVKVQLQGSCSGCPSSTMTLKQGVLNFTDKNFNNKEFTNNSKNILNNTLNKDKLLEEDLTADADERDLLYDILEENNSEINLVRYTTSEIDSLFKEVNYNLKDVRDTKLVKPIDIGLLPNEIKNIANTKKRKDMFIKIVLPLIVKENNKIRVDRKRLFTILNKNSNTDIEKKWLEKKYKQYGVRKNDLSTLKVRMDEIPVSLAIAQAAKETGWGTSRFALKGNALFGQWTWSGEGLKPKNADEGKDHKVMKFHSLQLSVRAYLRNLNTHSTYKNLRKARTELRNQNKPLDSLILSKHLDKYAETGNQYIEVLQKIIEQNNLKDFDEARLLPSSKDLESLI